LLWLVEYSAVNIHLMPLVLSIQNEVVTLILVRYGGIVNEMPSARNIV